MIDVVDLHGQDVPKRLESALTTTGFVELVGHDLDSSIRSEMRRVCAEFFSLDHDSKSQYVLQNPVANRGYRGRGSEALSYSLGEESPPDLFESFNASPDPKIKNDLLQSTPWPDALVPGFSDIVTASFDDFATLARHLDGIIGDLLGVDWLADRSGHGPDTLVNINYRPDPDGNEAVLSGQQRMGAHCDYTSFTLLDADPVRGLQIMSPSGEWVDAHPSAEGILLNVGDLLAMMTNDGWPSTLHRVIPMAAGAAAHRRSVAFFHYPNLDVEVAPLDNYVSETNAPRYEPVTVEDHLLGKLVGPKTRTPSTAASTVAGRNATD